MKVSKEQAGQNRGALLDAASRLYREHGLEGIGVAQIAREAGLTHGSLYGHFESKDHFAAEACEHAFVSGLTKLKHVEPGDERALSGFFRSYLSERHRDSPSSGCPIAALASEAARHDGPVADIMTRGIETYVKLFAERFGAADPDATPSVNRDRAMAALATAVGGLILARATAPANARLSKQMLAAAFEHIGEDTSKD
jgi:TetR/AcrR family transcriptional regulator, transcriptional repressor for nem operon